MAAMNMFYCIETPARWGANGLSAYGWLCRYVSPSRNGPLDHFWPGSGCVIATPSNQIMHAPLYEVPKWQIPWHLYHEWTRTNHEQMAIPTPTSARFFALLFINLLCHHMQVHFLYTRYFSSMTAITITILDIINERVLPLSAKGYEVQAHLNTFHHGWPLLPLPLYHEFDCVYGFFIAGTENNILSYSDYYNSVMQCVTDRHLLYN